MGAEGFGGEGSDDEDEPVDDVESDAEIESADSLAAADDGQ